MTNAIEIEYFPQNETDKLNL